MEGQEALESLKKHFPNFHSKQSRALPRELDSFSMKASLLVTIDYVVSLNNDVFMPSNGVNMGHAIQVPVQMLKCLYLLLII